MKTELLGKLIGAWFVFMLTVPAAVIWIGPDFQSGLIAPAILKLCLICGLAGAACQVSIFLVVRQWSGHTRRFEEFIAALPSGSKDLPGDGPIEIQRLGRTITEMAGRVRHFVEQANLEASRRETILACMAEGVLAVDRDLKVVFCNSAFAEAFSTPLRLVEGRALFEVVREPVLRDILQRVVTDGETASERLQLPSAAGKWFEARALPFGPSSRRSAVIVLHDITDIQRQEQLRKDFVADVSHELRTPLAAIRGYAETLLDGGLEDTDHNRKFVEIIHAHSIRLNNIASDLLVLSSLDSEGAATPTASRVEMLDVISSAINTVTVAAENRGITVDTSECDACAVMGVRFRLEQVVVNLLDNAVKFNRDGGWVKVECRRLDTGGRVSLSISDSGPGIPSGDLSKIFERFYRVDKARSRTAGGTGLGLPIVKEAITRMGGTVEVSSQLGRGATFVVTLPAG